VQVAVTRDGAPVPAEIFLDGRSYGKAPVFIEDIAPGAHTLEARAEGRAQRRTITVRPGADGQSEPLFWSP
jgi:hypothetical protein